MGPEHATRSWHPSDEDDYEAKNAELKRRFAAWAADEGLEVDPDAPELMLHYKWGYLDGHLTRWTRDNLSELYLDVFPAKVILEDDELDQVIEEARAFLRFLDSTGLLEERSEPADALNEHLARIEPEFRTNMADPLRHSMGKRFMTAAAQEGVGPTDQAGLDAFIDRFNARPRQGRDGVVGPPSRSHGRATPPGTQPRPASSKHRKRRR